jgi:hypothetical protein
LQLFWAGDHDVFDLLQVSLDLMKAEVEVRPDRRMVLDNYTVMQNLSAHWKIRFGSLNRSNSPRQSLQQ